MALSKTISIVGHVAKHDHFQIKKNGRWYTVHAHTIENFNDDNSNTGRGEFYVIAVSSGKMYVFHHSQKIITQK